MNFVKRMWRLSLSKPSKSKSLSCHRGLHCEKSTQCWSLLLSVLSSAVLAAPMRLPVLPVPIWSCCCGPAPSLGHWTALRETSPEKDPLLPCRSLPSHSTSQRWTHGAGNPFPVLLLITLAFSYSSDFLSFFPLLWNIKLYIPLDPSI